MDHRASRSKRWQGIAAVALWLLAIPSWAQGAAEPVLADLSPDRQQSTIGTEILDKLAKGHYRSITLDDQISGRIFDSYFRIMDPTRSHFWAADLEEFEPLRTRFDDLLKAGDLDPAFEIFNRYRQRLAERLRFVIRIVVDDFDSLDFEKKESLARKNAAWAGSMAELRARWRRQLKGDVLNRMLAGTKREEVREAVRRRYSNQLTRLAQTNNTDVFRVYTNAFLSAIDPHTSYFPPHQSENFNIHMSLSLEGIGAVLQGDGESVKVLRLVVGGPADKAGDLRAGDRIVGVGQGEEGEMVDILGMRLDEVVSLIRGPKETTVRLEIIPQVSTTEERRIIRIVRNKVDLEDQQASSRVMEVEHGARREKIGVIRLPTFYVDFAALRAGDPNYKSTAGDVKRLIAELEEAKIGGLVIDLRNNGGGALQEAIKLVGLFINRGPVVQVRDGRGVIRVHSDTDPSVVYSGPLAVLVNRHSASASEIFAGAVQDYGRGLVLGGQTFGKGTVQTLIPIRKGHLKLTQAKFYRISGESTQHRGVIPDIELPGVIDKTEVGESSLDYALAWDSIDKTRYSPAGGTAPYLQTLAARHRRRVNADPDFAHLMARIARLEKERGEAGISLNEKTRRAKKKSDELRELESENTRRVAKGEKPFASFAELEAYNEKKTAAASSEDDPILDEAANILADFIELTRAPAASTQVSPNAPKSP
jgi:carboxyl-terminal processing protease